MADPQYPNVPNTAGVPPVRRRDTVDAGLPLAKQKASIAQGLTAGKWGIYSQGGSLVIEADNIAAFEYAVDYRLADYPLEAGAFETYDKVAMPFDTAIIMTKGGTLAARTTFLKTLESLQGKLDLYNVVTPEKTYLNVNISHVSMQRTSERGTAMITVEVRLREIRQTAKQAFTKSESPVPAPTPAQDTRPPTTNPGTTRTPAATRRVNNGAVQPARPRDFSAAEKDRIRQSWAATGRTVIFDGDPTFPGGSGGRF